VDSDRHVKYTIPPAILLTLALRPLCTKLDAYRITLLISVSLVFVSYLARRELTPFQIAVVSTIPWDSHLIRTSIWTYSPKSVLGPTFFSIPIEEVFFFVIQTYITSLIYLLVNRPIVHAAYIRLECDRSHPLSPETETWRFYRTSVQSAIVLTIGIAAAALFNGGSATYISLILTWALPFLLLLFSLSYQLLFTLPLSATLLPVAVPTLYLWLVDTVSLRSGTWTINPGTKTGLFLWPHLELEEAIFFLLTNCLVVFGQLAFDNALAVLELGDPQRSREARGVVPSPARLARALLISPSGYDELRIQGLKEGVNRLQNKSRSFYLASSAFQGPLRVDMVLLYSFCRVADDLVDEAADGEEGRDMVKKLQKFLDLSYNNESSRKRVRDFVRANFPAEDQSALLLLPTNSLSKETLMDLVRGLEMDLQFPAFSPTNGRLKNHSTGSRPPTKWPIKTFQDLETYGSLVAGTVGTSVLDLTFAHCTTTLPEETKQRLRTAASQMGTALQLINVIRDVRVDAKLGRVYLPSSLLLDAGLTPEDVLADPGSDKLREVRMKSLKHAFDIYNRNKGRLDDVPPEARNGFRVAVESYVEIGRCLWERGCVEGDLGSAKGGRASVPLGRRVWVAWWALKG
jgi:15-cis-phytoene synthase / lycopene beta-cyclase